MQQTSGLIGNLAKLLLGVILTFALAFVVVPPAIAEDEGESTGEELLDQPEYGVCGMSTFMQESAAATYHSLTSRIDGHGMAPTSLTGLYPDGLMYLRDGSAQALTMIEANDTDRAMPLIRYLLQYSLASGFQRNGDYTFPHRVPAIKDKAAKKQENVSQIAFSADANGILIGSLPSSVAGASKQLTKIQIPLANTLDLTENYTIRIFAGAEDPMQIATKAVSLKTSTTWVEFELPPPGYATENAPTDLTVTVVPASTERSVLDAALEEYQLGNLAQDGNLKWMGPGAETPAYRAFTDAYGFNIAEMNGNDNHKLGDGRTWDEMDENMHVFYAWSQYILKTQDEEFLLDTGPAVSNFMEFYLTRNVYWLNTPGAASTLLKNPRLDAVGYHDGVYDLVTNVFASGVFESFHQISQELPHLMPSAAQHNAALTWNSLHSSIDKGIKDNLVKKVDGKSVYIPWLKPDKKPDLDVGAIWVTLLPNAINWSALDPAVMRNTIARYHSKNSLNFGGVRMLNARYSANAKPTVGTQRGYTGEWILLKSLMWEYQFEHSQNNQERLAEISLWVSNYFPSTQVPAPESWIVNYPTQVPVRDGGNQEHSSWYVSGLLKSFPGCAGDIVSMSGGYTPPPRVGNYTPIPFDRYGGSDRTQTSTLTALAVYGDSKPNSVYLARGDNYVDAISGGGLNDGPILLLSSGGKINGDITRALKKLKPKRVVALGGTGVISDKVLDQAAKVAGSKKKRLAGNDRFGTAAAIATESFAQAKAAGKPHNTLYLADGFGPGNTGSPDAVSAGGLSDGATILINPKSKTLPASTKAVIGKIKPQKVIALGGVAVVNNSVLNEAKKVAGAKKSSRLFGQDRYETSVAISQHAASYHAREIILVRGDELADSVTAGGVGRGPIILTPSTQAPASVIYEVKRIRPWKVNVLGGSAVLADRVVKQVALEAVKPG